MTARSIQLAPGMSAENITPSAHASETSVGAGASFAEHLDNAVQSSLRQDSHPEAQPAKGSRAKQASDAAPQTPRTQVNASHSVAPRTKQSSSTSGKTTTGGKAQSSDASPIQKPVEKPEEKDDQRQPARGPIKGSRPSDSSQNADGHQASEREMPADSKTPFAQALAQNAASQSPASGASPTTQCGEAQSIETGAETTDVSIPAGLLALLQAMQRPAQVQPETISENDPNAIQTDSSSTSAATTTPSNLFQSLNFSASNAAYQAALTNFRTVVQQAAPSTPSNGDLSASQAASSANSLPSADQQTSASSPDSETASTESSTSVGQATSENNQSVPPTVSSPQVNTSIVSLDSTAASASATEPVSSAANAGPIASTPVPDSQAKVTTSPAHAVPSTNGQQADTNSALAAKSSQVATEPVDLIKDLKSGVGQHEDAKPTLEQGLTAASKVKAEPVAPELQPSVTSVTVLTTHASSPSLSRQANATDSQAVTTSQDSATPAVSVTQGSAPGWTDDPTGDSAEDDDASTQGSASQGSNGSKSSGDAAEFLPSSAFNGDAVDGVAPAAVHAVAQATLQSNTGFDNASSKTPEAVPQNPNSAAQEKAFAAWQDVSAQMGRVVNAATLNALQNGTEMRVQLRTDTFGSMDIRATLEGGKVAATIGVENADTHSVLLSQLPALQQSLNERQVPLDQISVVSSYGQSATDFGTGSGKQNGDPTRSDGYHQQASGPEQPSETVSAPVAEAWQPAMSQGRLSVRA